MGKIQSNPALLLALHTKEEIEEKVWGRVTVHYNELTDKFEVIISNRALNCDSFRYYFPCVSKEANFGTTAGIIARFIISEYESYIRRYIYRA